MNIKSRSKRKKSKRKTKKQPISEYDLSIINNAVIETVNNPIVSGYVRNVEASPTTKNMKEYALLIEIVTKDNIIKYGKYSPSINKRLESIRETTPIDIFGCGAESVLKKTRTSNNFNIRIGNDAHGNAICVESTSKEARAVFMKNFKSNASLNPSNIIAPMQSHSNCWFNTMFMCFFVSDKGRKFMRFFRQLMIESKLSDGTPIIPSSLATTFIMFNAAIEACYNIKNDDNRWLALNTNNIIVNIYNSIPSIDGIKNIDDYGNPYNYYQIIMRYLDAKNNSIHTERYGDDKSVRNFYSSSNKSGVTPDVVVIELTDNSNINARSINYKDKSLQVNYNGATYVLDSTVSRDVTKQHFCCGITCNGADYLFDGAAFSKLSKRKWKHWINRDYRWKQKGLATVWNFMRGYSMFFYYRIT
jgi:hypothetical protein